MDPEVRESKPGACPKCGMALEPAAPSAPAVKTEYVCPMHPEIVRPEPGFCPICGMALEPRTVTLEEEANPELVDMTRRFWVSVVLSAPIAFLAMSDMIPGQPLQRIVSPQLLNWLQLRFGDSGGSLGRMAFLSKRLGFNYQPQLEHVHAYRYRRRNCLCLQCRCHSLPTPLSPIFPRTQW